MKNYHVTPREEGWAVKQEGKKRAAKVFDTQQEAFDYGRVLVKKDAGELFLHNRQNKIRERNTYGKRDPFPPKG